MEQVNKKLTEQIPPVTPTGNMLYINSVGDKQYELANLPIPIGMGNVLNVVTDRKLPFDSNANLLVDYSIADVKTYSDYYPYGMQLPYRKGGDGETYRYGFIGMEKDNELKVGDGNSYTSEFRQYDPRIGRWLSLDPLKSKYPGMSPYNYAGNSPLLFKDKEGDTLYIYGSEREWLKFKALVEKEFDGRVKLTRDSKNRVTIFVDYKTSDNLTDALRREIHSIRNRKLYQVFLKSIKDEDNVKMKLVNTPSDRARTFVGSFRSGELNGDIQGLDADDITKLEKNLVYSVEAAIIHEVEEAYQDQAVNNSPTATTEDKKFEGPHNISLDSQRSGTDYVESQNLQAIDARDGKIKVFFIAKKNTGNYDISVVTLNPSTNQIAKTENFANPSYSITPSATPGGHATVTFSGGTKVEPK